MSSTIDAAGRVVVPKALREAMGLTPGTRIDFAYVDGGIRIEFAPMNAHLDTSGPVPRIVPEDHGVVTINDDDVRATLESTRR